MSELLQQIRARRLALEQQEQAAVSASITDSQRARAIEMLVQDVRHGVEGSREMLDKLFELLDDAGNRDLFDRLSALLGVEHRAGLKAWIEAKLAEPMSSRRLRDEIVAPPASTPWRGQHVQPEASGESLKPEQVAETLRRSTWGDRKPYVVTSNMKPAYPVSHWWQPKGNGDWLKG